MSNAPFRLELEVQAPGRLCALDDVLRALQRIKQLQFGNESDDGWVESDDGAAWSAFLDDAARAHFDGAFDYDSEEGGLYLELWALTEPSKRSDPRLNLPGPWSYAAIIAAIYSCEYLLEPLRVAADRKRATLVYEPLAGPFGGTEALVQLVEGFGQRVTYDSWNKGPPRRPNVGWDADLARRLVAEGRGLD